MTKQAHREIRGYICPPRKQLIAKLLICPAVFALVFLGLSRIGKPPKPPLSVEMSLIGATVMTLMLAALLLWPWLAGRMALRRVNLLPEALLDDFRGAEARFGGRMRIGSRYIYLSRQGELVPAGSVERFNKSREETKYRTTWIVAVMDSGLERRCLECTRGQMEEMDVEGEIRRANEALQRKSKE